MGYPQTQQLKEYKKNCSQVRNYICRRSTYSFLQKTSTQRQLLVAEAIEGEMRL